ncbi:hypothetical protein M33023_00340 [Candidatus Phytoplasma asteris]|uniref:Uncharacterized protein n=1 Tax=Candidatus Phytoplasma asteris TaxID=85620 RepID=A0ABZ2YEB3_9MOLU
MFTQLRTIKSTINELIKSHSPSIQQKPPNQIISFLKKKI